MLKFTVCIVAGSLLALGVGATSAQAQTRVFVGAQGSDSNPCTFAAPCRTFQHAHDIVQAAGEINVLDPAGYGVLVITKPLSIQGHGFAGVSVPGNRVGITINGGPTDAVELNGLIIDGAVGGAVGIEFNSGQYLTIQDCFVHSATDFGIFLNPGGSGAVKVAIHRVTIAYMGGSDLAVFGTSQSTPGTLDVTVSDSVFAHSIDGAGISATAGFTPVRVMVERSRMVGNKTGLVSTMTQAAQLSTIWLGGSTISGNVTSWSSPSLLFSYGDNAIDGNDDGDPAPTTRPRK